MGNVWVIELSFLVASSKALDLRRLREKFEQNGGIDSFSGGAEMYLSSTPY